MTKVYVLPEIGRGGRPVPVVRTAVALADDPGGSGLESLMLGSHVSDIDERLVWPSGTYWTLMLFIGTDPVFLTVIDKTA